MNGVCCIVAERVEPKTALVLPPSLRTDPPPSPPDFDLLSKLTSEMTGSALSLERLLNVQRWRRHVQSFGHSNRDQARNPTPILTHAGVLKDGRNWNNIVMVFKWG